jgi:hypothetical protein
MPSLPQPLLSLLVALPLLGDWPEWRGPGGEGHATARGLPTTWSETENVAWKTPLPGRAWSSPVIDGDQVWLSTAIETQANPTDAARRLKANTGDQPLTLLDKVELQALCLDRRSGRLLHTLPLLTEREPQWVHELNSFASPTPVLEPGRAYFHFGTFGTVCVDTLSATVLWTNSTLRIMHENGPGSSPILVGDLLVFHLDGSDTQSIAALSKKSGQLAWRTARSGAMADHIQLRKSYATPMRIPLDGQDTILSQGADWLYAYDPVDGRELWKLKYGSLGFSLSSRAVSGHGMIFLATGYMRSEMQAIRLNGRREPVHAWKYAKGAPTMSSPLLVGDELYFISDSGGMLTCLDARTGTELYRERLGGSHSASPIFADGHILLPSREGVTSVVAPGKTFRLVAKNTLPGKMMATPAAVGDSLFLRTDSALYRIASSTR